MRCLSLFLFIFMSFHAFAQGAAIGGVDAKLYQNDSSLKTMSILIKTLGNELGKFRLCSDKKAIYAPLDPSKDSDGCVDLMGDLKEAMSDCAKTNGSYDPEDNLCREMVYTIGDDKYILDDTNCTVGSCNNESFDVSEYVNQNPVGLYFYVTFAYCGRGTKSEGSSDVGYYDAEFDYTASTPQTKRVKRDQTRSGKHGSYVDITYNPSSKKVTYTYGGWGGHIYCHSGGDQYNNHMFYQRGVRIKGPKIDQVTRPPFTK